MLCACVAASSAKQVRSADCESAAVDGRTCALAGSHLERLRCRDGNSAVGGHRDDRTRDGMLRIALHRRSKPQRIMVGNAVDGAHRKHAELAKRKCSGFVEHDSVDVARILETAPVADEKTGPCAERRRDRDHQRHGEAERMRAGDHQHGYEMFDRGGRTRSGQQPGDEGHGARAQRDACEPERGAVGERLCARA